VFLNTQQPIAQKLKDAGNAIKSNVEAVFKPS
jgi:hypothetical protein